MTRSHLREEEHDVRHQPHAAGVHHHLTDGHLGGADRELPAQARVTLAVQGYGFAADVGEGLVLHHERGRNRERGRGGGGHPLRQASEGGLAWSSANTQGQARLEA